MGRNFAKFHSNMGGNVELGGGGEKSGGYNGDGKGRMGKW